MKLKSKNPNPPISVLIFSAFDSNLKISIPHFPDTFALVVDQNLEDLDPTFFSGAIYSSFITKNRLKNAFEDPATAGSALHPTWVRM